MLENCTWLVAAVQKLGRVSLGFSRSCTLPLLQRWIPRPQRPKGTLLCVLVSLALVLLRFEGVWQPRVVPCLRCGHAVRALQAPCPGKRALGFTATRPGYSQGQSAEARSGDVRSAEVTQTGRDCIDKQVYRRMLPLVGIGQQKFCSPCPSHGSSTCHATGQYAWIRCTEFQDLFAALPPLHSGPQFLGFELQVRPPRPRRPAAAKPADSRSNSANALMWAGWVSVQESNVS